MKVHSFLLVAAILLFLFAGIGDYFASPEWPWRHRLIAWGLCCWALSTIITA